MTIETDELLAWICKALGEVRIRKILDEIDIQNQIEQAFAKNQIPFQREFRIAPHCRPDFFVEGVVVEVKKRRPVRSALIAQAERYARQPEVKAVVIVLEKSIDIPDTIAGRPARVISLNRNWGIAL